MANTDIKNFLEDYMLKREDFYRSSGRQQQLFLEFKEIVNANDHSIVEEIKTFCQKTAFDFYLKFFLTYTLINFGKVKEAKLEFEILCEKLLRLKKYNKFYDFKNFLGHYFNSLNSDKELEERIKIATTGICEKEIDYRKIFLDVEDVKRNPDVFLRSKNCYQALSSQVSFVKERDLLELILKAIPSVELNEEFYKLLAMVSRECKSEKINSCLLDVKQTEGFEFELLRVDDHVRKRPEVRVEYNSNIGLEHLEIESELGLIEEIADLRESLYFEDLNSDQVLHLIYEMASRYKKLGHKAVAIKLFKLIQLKSPNFRRVRERLIDLE